MIPQVGYNCFVDPRHSHRTEGYQAWNVQLHGIGVKIRFKEEYETE